MCVSLLPLSQGINCCSRLYCAAVLAAIAVLIFNNLLQILLTHFVKINIFCKHENFEANKLGCNKKLQWNLLQHFLTLNPNPNIEWVSSTRQQIWDGIKHDFPCQQLLLIGYLETVSLNWFNSPWRIRHTNPKMENWKFLEFHFLPPKYC